MLATIRLILGGLIFAQTIRVAWRAWRRRRRPTHGALPWDPSAIVRIAPLDPTETARARARERGGLTAAATLQRST